MATHKQGTIVNLADAIAGVEQFTAKLKKLSGTESGINELIKIVAGISAASEQIKGLGSLGEFQAAEKHLDKIIALANKISKIKLPKMPEEPVIPEFVAPKIPTKKEIRKQILNGAEPTADTRMLVNKAFKEAQRQGSAQRTQYTQNVASINTKYNNDVAAAQNEIKLLVKSLQGYRLSTDRIRLASSKIESEIQQDVADRTKRRQDLPKDAKNKIKQWESLQDNLQQRDYAEQAADIESEFRRRKSSDAQRIKVASLKQADYAGKTDIKVDKSFTKDEAKAVQESLRKELLQRKELLELRKAETAAAKLALTQSQSEEELAKNKVEYAEALSRQQAAGSGVADTQEKLRLAKEIVSLRREEASEAKKAKDKQDRIDKDNAAKEKKAFDKLRAEAEQENKIFDIKKKAKELTDSITKGGGGLTRDDLLFRVREINAELGKLPDTERKLQAGKVAEQLKQAGIHTRELNGKLEVTRVQSSKVQSHFAKTIQDMFSMEKLISRISFVITAKMSYVSFDRAVKALKDAVMLNINFRDEMSKTIALMQNETTSMQEGIVRDTAAAARKYRVDLKETSQAMYQIISAQIAAKDAAEVLNAAMQLSVGGFANVNDAALALVQTLNAFDLEAGDAAHVADVMFQTTKLGIITTQQYSDQISKIASTASMFGLSIEDVSAAISSMTRNGVKVDQAFTSLNQLLMTIVNPTEEAKKTMEAYGVSIDMNTIRAQGLIGALKGLGPILKSEEAMTNIVKSRTGAKAMFSLVQNEADYINDLVQMYNSTGAAAEATESRLNTTASLFKQLKSEAADFGLLVGKSLERDVRGLMESAIGGLQRIRWMLPGIIAGMKGLAATFVSIFSAKTISAIIGVGRSLLNLGSIAKVLGTIFQAVWAKATLGVSILIGAIVALVSGLATARKKAEELSIDRAMNVDKASDKLDNMTKQIEELDSKMNALEGLNKLVYQADELYKAQLKNKDLSETFNKVHKATVGALEQILGIQIDSAKTQGKLSQFNAAIHKAWMAQKRAEIKLLLEKQAIEARTSISQTIKDSKEVKGKARTGFYNSVQKPLSQFGISLAGLQFDIDNPEATRTQFKQLKMQRDALQRDINRVTKQRADKGFTPTDEETDIMLNAQSAINDFNTLMNNFEGALIQESFEDYNARVSEMAKEIDKGSSSKKREKQDKIKEVIDKYTDLFRTLGFSVESSYEDKLSDITTQIEALRRDAYNILPSGEIVEMLNSFGIAIKSVYNFDTIAKKKTKTIYDVVENNKKLTEEFAKMYDSRGELERLSKQFQKSGIPELIEIGSGLMEMFDTVTTEAINRLDDYKEEQFEGLISSARSDAEKEELSKIILELDAELFNKVTEMSISELEEFIEESTTKDSIKPYIKSHILDKRKTLGNALVALAGKTGLFIDDIEKGIDSLSSLVDKLRKASSAQGIDIQSNDLIKIFSAYIANDQETLENYAKNTRLSRQPLATINGSPNTQYMKTIPSYDDYSKLGDTEKGMYLEHFKHLYGGFKNDTYQSFLDQLKTEAFSKSQSLSDEINKIKTSIPVSSESSQFTVDKSASKSNVQFIADFLLWGRAYPGTRDQKGFGIAKNSDEIGNMNNLEEKLKSAYGKDAKALIDSDDYKKMSIDQKYYALAQFLQSKQGGLSKVNKKYFSSQFSPKNPVIATPLEVAELKNDLQNDRLPGLESELKDVNNLINFVVEQQSEKQMTVKEVLELIYEFVKDSDEELASEIEAALQSGDSRRQRNIIRKNMLGVESAGDQSWASLFESDKNKNPKRLETIGDFIKDKVGFGKGITIDEAFNMTVSKGYDIAYGALMAHYDREIEATERRNQRLMELEQQKQDAMLANENMSASEREVIQKKFAERQRKMQEALDKKVAEQRKKQALAELTINYAKGMAEVFIRELSSKGGLGLLSSAALMGLMTTLYLVQRNAIDKQKFASGGYTGTGYGQADSTGQRPAGIVHEKELVIDRNTLAKNFDPLMSMYANMRRGASFEEFAMAYMSGRAKSGFVGGVKSGLYASGGYTGNSTDNIIVNVEMGSMRVLDDVDLAIMVERGGKRRRFING